MLLMKSPIFTHARVTYMALSEPIFFNHGWHGLTLPLQRVPTLWSPEYNARLKMWTNANTGEAVPAEPNKLAAF